MANSSTAGGQALILTKENLQEKIQGSSTLVIDFWAPWCGPCRAFAPVFESVAALNPDIVFGKINTDEQQEVAAAFNIRSIPTLAVFKDKELIYIEPGALPEDSFNDLIKKVKEINMEELRKQADEAENQQKK